MRTPKTRRRNPRKDEKEYCPPSRQFGVRIFGHYCPVSRRIGVQIRENMQDPDHPGHLIEGGPSRERLLFEYAAVLISFVFSMKRLIAIVRKWPQR